MGVKWIMQAVSSCILFKEGNQGRDRLSGNLEIIDDNGIESQILGANTVVSITLRPSSPFSC
jgi:hypothetical protein